MKYTLRGPGGRHFRIILAHLRGRGVEHADSAGRPVEYRSLWA